ncbi:hypothetical protein IEQ34_000589 [Dendrobium chrysotoxum]|uniref:Uncharacterized protein n=1 Tax=Dendrobium chrysotoxum TaxID=161865 RepID=A0AAV7HNY3_DENCH|nr:hypothetical protein IEQ34_000589 [Dendrobium chrysotoxum]
MENASKITVGIRIVWFEKNCFQQCFFCWLILTNTKQSASKKLESSIMAWEEDGSFTVVLACIDHQAFCFHDNPQIHMNLRKET